MADRVALYLQDAHPIQDAIRYVQLAESRGFEAVWQAESRLVRDAIVPMAAFAATTSRIKIGSGVINNWTRNAAVIAAVNAEFGDKLSPEAANAAKAAAAIMAMNNIYYRFVHLASAADYKTLPARLRMNVIAKPGVEKVDFELWSLAVSAVNGCGMCIDSHEHELRKAGLSAEQIQAAIRIASVVHAVAVTLESEVVLSDTSLSQAA